MDRGSDKETPRLDEEMKQESQSMERGAPVESRVEGHRESEGGATAPPAGDTDEVAVRREIARFLRPSSFPGDREAMLRSAREEGATGSVIEELESLPDGVTFATVADVLERLGRPSG